MAVLPKKYDRHTSVEDYVLYMSERIEFFAQATDKKVRALEDRCAELEAENKALKEKIGG